MYLDSAIIVKLVIHEADSHFYAQALQGKTGLKTSALARTECYAALCRKQREGAITATVRQTAWTKIEGFFAGGSIQLVPITDKILADANLILEKCQGHVALRSLDAIHLATCQATGAFPIYANDQRLRQAATHLQCPVATLPLGTVR